jgi:hypothetical protein
MTQQFGDHSSPESGRSTPDVARDEAADVARTAADRGGEVAGTVSEQASRVASEAGQQTRNLLHESREQLNTQARQGQQRAADGLHTLAAQLRQMSEKTDEGGMAAEVARQASDRAHGLASWLERREPGDLVDEVRRFARRKPGMFLVGAALAGVAVGRLTRGAIAAQSDDSDSSDNRTAGQASATAPTPAYGTQEPTGYPAAPTTRPYVGQTPDAPGYAMPPATGQPGYAPPPAPQRPGYPAPPAPDPQRGW